MIGLNQNADVYTADDNDGDYTVLAKSGLACRLVVGRAVAATAAERADLAAGHQAFLLWGASYTMPANAQVLVNDRQWNVQEQTVVSIYGISGDVAYQRAEVEVAL